MGGGAAPPAPTGTPPPTGGDWTAPDWAAGIEPEYLPTMQSKGWKTPHDAVRAYHSVQSFIGKDPSQLLSLPKAGDAAAWNQVYDKLGRPADAKDYNIDMPLEGGSDKLNAWARGIFHQAGLNTEQASTISKAWNEFLAGEKTGQETDHEASRAVSRAELTKAWGPETSEGFKNNVAIAKQAATQFGMTEDHINSLEQVMGLKAAMTMLHDIGSKLGEPGFSGGGGGGGNFNVMTPEKAEQEIMVYMKEADVMKAWTDNRHPRHKEVMDKISQLHNIAYSGNE